MPDHTCPRGHRGSELMRMVVGYGGTMRWYCGDCFDEWLVRTFPATAREPVASEGYDESAPSIENQLIEIARSIPPEDWKSEPSAADRLADAVEKHGGNMRYMEGSMGYESWERVRSALEAYRKERGR